MKYKGLFYSFTFIFLLFSFVSINACTSNNVGLNIVVPNKLEVLERNVTSFCVDKNCDNSAEYICGPNENGGADSCWYLKNKNKTYYYPNDSNSIYILFQKELDSYGKYKSNLDHYRFVYVNSIFTRKDTGSDPLKKPDFSSFKLGLEQLVDAKLLRGITKQDIDTITNNDSFFNYYVFYEPSGCKLINVFNKKIDKTKIGNSNWYYADNQVSYTNLGCLKLEPVQKLC